MPGHERFVRTMVAGATGVDLFLLVIAADDGVMPQTREHVAIIELLGVRDGVVALTKADLVDDELLELAEADVREFLETTPYAGVELVTVSARDGRGAGELLAALERAASRVVAGRGEGPARLPIDRVFPLKGIGTVVTGTLWRGELRAGDPVVIVPGGARTAVRSVQVHDHETDAVHAGSRVGVNLRGLDRGEVSRGDWLVAPELAAHVGRRFDAWVKLVPGGRPLRAGDRVRLHHGTAQYLARVAPLEGREIAAGAQAAAVVRLDGDAAVEPHDRFILRALSPVATVGGGVVLATGRRHWHDRVRHGAYLEAARAGDARAAALAVAADAGSAGLTAADLGAAGFTAAASATALAAAGKAGEVETLPAPGRAGAGARWFAAGVLGVMRAALVEGATDRAATRPERPFSSAAELAALVPALPARDVEAVLQDLAAAGELVTGEGGYAPSGAGVLGAGQEALAAAALERLEAQPVAPPTLAVLAEGLGRPSREAHTGARRAGAPWRRGARGQGPVVLGGRRGRGAHGAEGHACRRGRDPRRLPRPPRLRAPQRPGSPRVLRQRGPHPAARRRTHRPSAPRLTRAFRREPHSPPSAVPQASANDATWSRPRRLARYMAQSALSRSSSRRSASSG